MKNVRTIIWDLDETVWLYKDNEPIVLSEKLNIDDVDRFKKEYYEMWGKFCTHFKDNIVTQDTMKSFMSKEMLILEEYGVSVEEFLKAIREGKRKFVTLNHEAVEMMRYFSEKGFRNISITDWFRSDQENVLRSLGAHTYIQEIYGCDNDYLKSSIKKAEIMSKKLIIGRHEEFIVIGDSLSSDIFFANQLGIKSIWYNRKGKKNETHNIPTKEVKSLLDLKEVL